MKQNLEDWARTVYGLPDAVPDTAPDPAEYPSEESDEEEDDDDDHENQDKEHLKTLTFTNIEKAYQFLHKSVPFQTLVLQLRLLGLPTSLREIIETSPKRSIKISAKNDSSFMNRIKGIVETYTVTQWDWWPLAPRVPDVAPDRLRLEWQVSKRSPGTYCVLTCQLRKVLQPASVQRDIVGRSGIDKTYHGYSRRASAKMSLLQSAIVSAGLAHCSPVVIPSVGK